MIRFSGMKLVYDLSKPNGQRIASLSVNGKPISDDQMYSITSVHTRFQENPLFGANNVKDTGRVFVEELIDYIREHSPIAPILDDRIGPISPSS